MSDTWLYKSYGNTLGPVPFGQLQQLAATGALQPTDPVSADGAIWTPAIQIAGLTFPDRAPGTLSYPAPGLSNPSISERSVQLMAQTATWVRIMSVLMWVGVGFMLLGALMMIFLGIFQLGRRGNDFNPALMGVTYLAMAALYIVPAIFLTRYASHARAFARTRHEVSLENALQAQKSFWKFVTILTLTLISLYCVGTILFVAIMAIASGGRFP